LRSCPSKHNLQVNTYVNKQLERSTSCSKSDSNQSVQAKLVVYDMLCAWTHQQFYVHVCLECLLACASTSIEMYNTHSGTYDLVSVTSVFFCTKAVV